MEHVRSIFLLTTLTWSWFDTAACGAANSTLKVRLVGGGFPNQGRVEVRLPGEETWGTYCSNDNPFFSGRVLCRHLGFPALFQATAIGQYGWATGPIALQKLSCSESDPDRTHTSLDDCLPLPWYPAYDVCDHRFDVGISCFTGDIRLVESSTMRKKQVVELHIGGQEWVRLAYVTGTNFQYSDFICRHLGYPFSVGATEEPPDMGSQQKTLCSFYHCPLYGDGYDFFQCIDDLSLKLCPDGANTTLLGADCVKENDVIPTDANLEYHLNAIDGNSRHKGIVEARYNETDWKTVCVLVLNDFRIKVLADDVCKNIGYPWAFTWETISYAESTGYVGTRDELIMRELYVGWSFDHLKWFRARDACQNHGYPLISVECEAGTTLYGLKIFPCWSQTCLDRCGNPATEELCGCDDICSKCGDCCHDFDERCPRQHNATLPKRLDEITAESYSCKVIRYKRVLIVHECQQNWNETDTAGQCGKESLLEPVKWDDGVFFRNEYCAECNGVSVAELYSDSFLVTQYDVGIDSCSLDDKSSEVELGCRSYSSLLKTPDGQSYKNLHCAYCNGVNISDWNYCEITFTMVLPALNEILLGREPVIWLPEATTNLELQDEINCFDVQFELHLHLEAHFSGETSTSDQALPSTSTLCYITTLGWQNIQMAWPFYESLVENRILEGSPKVTTRSLANVTAFEALLDQTVIPSHEEGSSRDWVVRCGVRWADFVEKCDTNDYEESNSSCDGPVFNTSANVIRVFNMSGLQIIYVGGGTLVKAQSVYYVRTYRYDLINSNSSDKDTGVSVCGETFYTAGCRITQIKEILEVSSAYDKPAIKFKGMLFLKDDIVYLPDDWVLICSSSFDEPYISLSDPLTLLNVTGYILSLVALMATFANYCIFPVLRNVPGRAVMSLAVALFSAQLLTLTVLDKADNKAFCTAMAVLMHYLWLSTITWMNVLAFDLTRTFTSTNVSRPSERVFATYCLYAWGAPLLIVGACIIIHFTAGQTLEFRYGGERSCWVDGPYAVLGAVLIPIECGVLANAALFARTVRSVHASLVAASMVRNDKTKSKETLRELWIYFKISFVMGFTWLFGCLGTFVDHQVIWYLFVILNSLQGVFVFASFGCNIRIRNLWREKLNLKERKRFRNPRSPNGSITTVTTSTFSGTGDVSSQKNQEAEIPLHEQ